MAFPSTSKPALKKGPESLANSCYSLHFGANRVATKLFASQKLTEYPLLKLCTKAHSVWKWIYTMLYSWMNPQKVLVSNVLLLHPYSSLLCVLEKGTWSWLKFILFHNSGWLSIKFDPILSPIMDQFVLCAATIQYFIIQGNFGVLNGCLSSLVLLFPNRNVKRLT